MGHKHLEVNQVARELMSDLPRHDLGVDGMPICRRCGFQFHGWQSLLRHIQRGRCKGPVVVAEDTVPEAQRPLLHRLSDVQELIRTDFQCLAASPELRQELSRNCSICKQWVGDTRHVKLHLSKTHSDVWNKHKRAIETEAAQRGKGRVLASTVACRTASAIAGGMPGVALS